MKNLFAIVILVLTGHACTSSPTGRSQLILFSDSQMASMGAASFQQMKQQTPPLADAAISRYVQCLSNALLLAAGEQPQQWEVQVFEHESPNAFALPGRKIGVHTGMIELAATPAQLAAVIGHEIGHVQARHGAERVSLAFASQAGQQLAAITLQDNENAPLLMAAIGIGSQLGVLLPYSRSHESEADQIGLQLMATAGFDPADAVALWRNMAAAGGGGMPEFLSTHPSSASRIEQLGRLQAAAEPLYQQALAAGRRPDCRKP